MRLNIIGNGFDLYHGLPTSYYYFGCFLASQYPDFYAEMSNMYGFACYKRVGHDDVDVVVSDMFWKTFEEKLGYLDSCWMEHSLMDDLGLECDDPIDLDIPEVINSKVIKEKFCEWISTTINTSQNFDIVKSRISRNKRRFRNDDYFVNFNYTQTLEEVYDIPVNRVIHIHGECEVDTYSGNLIVGHGNYGAIQDLKQKIDEIENGVDWLGFQSERNRLREYECEKSILEDLRKNVPYLSSNLISTLNSMKLCIDEIRVWGFSCGSVDEKYILDLHSCYPEAKWKFSYWDQSEKKKRKNLAKKLGLNAVGYFKFVNQNSESICSEIVEQNHIDEYKKCN